MFDSFPVEKTKARISVMPNINIYSGGRTEQIEDIVDVIYGMIF